MEPGREFAAYHKKLLGREYEAFLGSMRSIPRHALRVNTLKANAAQVEKFLYENRIDFAKVLWCKDAYWVDAETAGFMEHQFGFYYIQDASSLLPSIALEPKAGESVLDLCAAPGSKTTHIAALMENSGMLVANEQDYRRIRALVYNVQRCGVSNAVVTMQDGVKYDQYKETFDKILVDAPCSDVGRTGINNDIPRAWSFGRVLRLSSLQKRLASAAFRRLKEDGVLVYSTCTTSVEENEQVVEHIISENKDARIERIKYEGLKSKKGLTDGTFDCMRILPHYNGTGGYFIARIRKCAKN
ncbi:MAG: RsmB/NOP family class I SAM-dependent RNA methyltransferase [Candidatus Altiarchaeota archaeon]|nr:RsmB/NOP family class I SAM-dependent RNA methyltransferase [Candidatus Altiarchaeota archaeon]